jgi:SAM-dependent methyltransferase
VSYLRGLGVDAYGFDHGFGAETAAAAGVPMLDEDGLKRMEGTVDVVSAIEVLEHLVEPQPALTQIARLLRPGGAFVYTTGNARRVKDLARWPYVIPEVHITFYTPETMTTLLRQSGLDPVWLHYGDGFDMLIRYKVLKNLRVKDRSPLQDLIPWTPIGAVLNRTHGITEMPFGRKR